MQTITLKISGMHCGGCVRSVTNVLSRLTGVINVSISLESETAVITADDRVAPNELIASVTAIGYGAQLL